jgi:hypothetical protein
MGPDRQRKDIWFGKLKRKAGKLFRMAIGYRSTCNQKERYLVGKIERKEGKLFG